MTYARQTWSTAPNPDSHMHVSFPVLHSDKELGQTCLKKHPIAKPGAREAVEAVEEAAD